MVTNDGNVKAKYRTCSKEGVSINQEWIIKYQDYLKRDLGQNFQNSPAILYAQCETPASHVNVTMRQTIHLLL